jgi:hypothetical protein
MKPVFVFPLLLSVSLPVGTPDAAETSLKKSAREIVEAADDAPDGDSRRTHMKMTLVSKSGRSRVRSLLSYSKDYGKDTKTIMQFKEPADVAGTTFLSFEYDKAGKDDDRWIYLPALHRVRRISGSSKNDYFMGSDFTYDDMGDRDIEAYTYRLLGEQSCFGGSCWKIESTAKDPVDAGYSKTISLIRKDALKTVYAEFYDRDKRLLKKLEVKDLQKKQGYWTIVSMEMHNVQSRHKTRLDIKEISYDISVRDSLFRPSGIERGRLQ